jgi:hypothetical protein
LLHCGSSYSWVSNHQGQLETLSPSPHPSFLFFLPLIGSFKTNRRHTSISLSSNRFLVFVFKEKTKACPGKAQLLKKTKKKKKKWREPHGQEANDLLPSDWEACAPLAVAPGEGGGA